jgi:hypothetical protein
MLKYTRETHPDHAPLKYAVEFIKKGLVEINQSTSNEELEHCKKMINVEKTIDGEFEVTLLLLFVVTTM